MSTLLSVTEAGARLGVSRIRVYFLILVDRLKARGFHVMLHAFKDGTYEAAVCEDDEPCCYDHGQKGDSLGQALCKVALKAVGYKPKPSPAKDVVPSGPTLW